MDIIFSGPYVPNPAELLESEYFGILVEKCRKEYDYTLVDTPPLGSVIDSAIVAGAVDNPFSAFRQRNSKVKAYARLPFIWGTACETDCFYLRTAELEVRKQAEQP